MWYRFQTIRRMRFLLKSTDSYYMYIVPKLDNYFMTKKSNDFICMYIITVCVYKITLSVRGNTVIGVASKLNTHNTINTSLT